MLLGVTQVINQGLIVQLNYSFSNSSGYLNDPYKLLSVVDPVTGDTIAVEPPTGTLGPDGLYRFESRPQERIRHGLFGRVKYWLGGDVLDLSYRYATDDWEIDSHTLDGRYGIALGDARYLEPHLRYYTQTEAIFYRFSLLDDEPLPEFAASDFRLGNFDAVTAGVEYGKVRNSGAQWSVRLEYYRQAGEVPAAQIVGRQAGREQQKGSDAGAAGRRSRSVPGRPGASVLGAAVASAGWLSQKCTMSPCDTLGVPVLDACLRCQPTPIADGENHVIEDALGNGLFQARRS